MSKAGGSHWGGFFEDECGWGLDSRKFIGGLGRGVRSGAALAVERGFANIIFENDSHQIFSTLRHSSVDMSIVGPIMEDTKSLLSQITGDGGPRAALKVTRLLFLLAAENVGYLGLDKDTWCLARGSGVKVIEGDYDVWDEVALHKSKLA
ncbi:PREDICTED: PRUPE_4G199700 [Prunus dulcis]|uniref:PREDICTED: PRUPE_4G199700 n=1 Tax=Prunus dulcis TaxID=3755 RepID=A0A5E4G2K3_PRUDU|nr:PREDICTED: PRUPE_4G199700 [Prunus dulcis]